MARYIEAEELKRHIRWEFMNIHSTINIGLEECKAIDKVIDRQTEIKVLDRDNGAEPILETKTSTYHECYADGTGEFKQKTHLDWTCPQCGWFVGELFCGYGKWHVQGEESFCASCGQKIDWTKPKEEEKRRYEETRRIERKKYFEKHGIRLDNLYENRRKKYGKLEE